MKLSLKPIILFLIMIVNISISEEFAFVPVKAGKDTVDDYFSKIGIKNIYLYTKCNKSGDVCWYEIYNSDGKRLDGGYNTKTNTLILKSEGRYDSITYAFIKHTYKAGDKYITKYFLINDRGYKTYFRDLGFDEAIKTKPLKNGNILALKENKIFEVSPKKIVKRINTPKLENGFIGNNPDGDISIIGYFKNDLVFISYENGNTKWLIDFNALSTHGDRKGILSIYPENKNISYSAVYRYVNPYNKGLVLYKIDFSNKKLIKGFLFNSEDRNIGFDPSIYVDKNFIVVSAKNSSDSTYAHFKLSKNDINKIQTAKVKHIKGWENEKNIEFLVSGKISTLNWMAYSNVEDPDTDTTYATAKYDLSNSIFYGASLQGRKGNKQIAISYLKNKAEKKGGLTAKASEIFTAIFDFNGIFGNQSTLRIGYEQGKINGFAKYTDEIKQTKEDVLFETDIKSLYSYVMKERGYYFGLEYLNYKIPSAIGFDDNSGNIVYYNFDKGFTLNSFLLVFGYDHVNYAKRYETNYKGLYFSSNIGLGVGNAKVSSEIKQDAKAKTGINDIFLPIYFLIKGYGEIGYLYQLRAKFLRGLGMSFNFGYRLTGMLITSGSTESDSNKQQLHLNFNRYELLHGLFAQLNIIF